MGFVLSLLYIVTTYLSPGFLFGSLAEYHLEVIVAVLAALASLPNLAGSGLLRAPQTYAVFGLCFAVLISLAATGWIGGAPAALYEFLPDCFAFFLVALNCRTRRRMQILIAVLVVSSMVIIVEGSLALRAGDALSPWVYDQGYEGNHILRMRGLGPVHDPNDLAQVLVSLLACSFLLWGRNVVWNCLFVLLPGAALLVGIFLTHSRGAIVALMAVFALSVYRRFGLLPAVGVAAAVFAAATALSFSGGREISAESGQDRIEAWSVGLQLIKSYPVFGVGYRRFTEYNAITAHNTVVVCAAELGLPGFFFWVLFVVSSVREGVVLRAQKVKNRFATMASAAFAPLPVALGLRTAGVVAPASLVYRRGYPEPISGGLPAGDALLQNPTDDSDAVESEASIRQMAWVMVVCFAGFLVAGWFLSRAYVMWLFLYGGMIHAIYVMAVRRGIAPAPIRTGRLLRLTLLITLGLLLLVYIILRVDRLLPQH